MNASSSRLVPVVPVVTALTALTLGAVACPKPQEPAAKPPATADAGPIHREPKRPPYPTMATAAWGQRVLEQRVAKVHIEGPAATRATVLDALHDMSPGSEVRAGDLAATWYQSASGNIDRGEAVALLAVSLVLDPTVAGYKERLTDAYGLAQYAGSLDTSSSLSQSARVVIGASAGAVQQAKLLLDVVETTPGISAEPRFFMALGQKLTGGKLDAALDDLDKALAARPDSMRARALLAETYLEIGLYPEAERAATPPGKDVATHPWLEAVRGRALVLDGKVDEGIKLLKGAQDKLDEGRRGDALYWLGRSLTQKDGSEAEVDTIIGSLTARLGYAKEAAVLEGLRMQKAGDYKAARDKLDPLVSRQPPVLPVDVDATWLLVDACAGTGDIDCVNRAGARAVSADGDYARLNLARAAVALVGKTQIDVADALREAHLASPFDPKLGAKVKEPVVPGGTSAANRVRAARRALMRHSPKLVELALSPLAKDASCRVCRALTAASLDGVDAVKAAKKALAGSGPPLCIADLVGVIHALGAAPTDEAKKALDALAGDKRPPIARALAMARADIANPEERKRRDAGASGMAPSPAAPPPVDAGANKKGTP